MSRFTIFLLGPPRLERDGEPIQISRRKVVALLAYLAVTGAPHSRDALATLLWPERSQSRARAYLRRALSELNRSLGEGFLAIDRETAGFSHNATVSLDVDEFRARLGTVHAHRHPETALCHDCLKRLEEAVELYSDDFTAGFTLRDSPAFDEWQFFQREALRGELAGALERLADAYQAQGEYERAIARARRWLELDPLAEAAHRRLMALYAASGQRNAALRQYAECERLLQEELGVPPEEETTALAQTLRVSETLRVSAPRHNLPVQATPFIGRGTELARIAELLDDPDCRLLTLIGLAGSGKTRLALEVAAAELERYPQGVFFVSLTPLPSPAALAPTIADVLGLRPFREGTSEGQLLAFLAQKRLLLVMDNYEHLLEGADLASKILTAAPEVKILATSRARLNVGGEYRYHVGGLDYPTPELDGGIDAPAYSAVQLYVQGAQRAQADFTLNEANREGVIDVCRLVQGMPLAIRLAAAWTGVLSPAGIAEEIRQDLDLLETERRDVPERQRSMRAAFDHSWRLLTGRQPDVFQALSVFRGPFSRDAAQDVTGASLRETRLLVDRSLLHPVAEGVYELHELLRQYAGEKLDQVPGAREAAQDRHCAYYAAALERWAADLKGPRSRLAPGEIDVEIENVRAAWNWAVEREHLAYLGQAVEGLWLYYDMRRRPDEAEKACRQAVAQLETRWFDDGTGWSWNPAMVAEHAEGLRVLARLLAWRHGFSRHWYGEPPTDRDKQQYARCLALLQDLETAGLDVRLEKAMILFRQGNMEESLALLRALGDDWMTANMLHNWSLGLGHVGGDYDLVRRLEDESVARYRAAGDQANAGWVLTFAGWTSCFYSNYADARERWEQSLPLHRALGDAWGEGVALHSLGYAAWLSGDSNQAAQLLEEALAIQTPLGDQRGLADSLHQLANVVLYQGQFEKAERLARESAAISRAIVDRKTFGEGCRALGMALVVQGRYAEGCSALEEGATIFAGLDWANEQLFQTIWQGRALVHLGEYNRAHRFGQRCLDTARQGGLGREIGLSLLLLGDVALAQGAHAEANDSLQQSLAVLEEIGYRPELASALASGGIAALGLGEVARAREHICGALRECLETRMVFPLLRVLPASALLLSNARDLDRAVELYALVSRYPYVANSRWFEDVAGKPIAAAAAELPPDVVAAAQERSRARDLWKTAEALLHELHG